MLSSRQNKKQQEFKTQVVFFLSKITKYKKFFWTKNKNRSLNKQKENEPLLWYI